MTLPLDFPVLVYLLMVIALGYFVRGIVGFGSGLISVPLLAMVLPLSLVVPLIVVLDYVASLSHGFGGKRHIVWRDIAKILPFSILGIVCAISLFQILQNDVLIRGLAVFIIAYAIYSWWNPQPQVQASAAWGMPLGFFGGLIGALYGTGGPFYVIYMSLRRLESYAFRATFAALFVFEGLFRIAGYAGVGMLDRQLWMVFLISLPVTLVMLYLGSQVHTRLSRTMFQRMISGLLLVSGAVLLVKTL